MIKRGIKSGEKTDRETERVEGTSEVWRLEEQRSVKS